MLIALLFKMSEIIFIAHINSPLRSLWLGYLLRKSSAAQPGISPAANSEFKPVTGLLKIGYADLL